VGVWVCGCVYKIENFKTLSAPSEIASLREAISSSAAFEQEQQQHKNKNNKNNKVKSKPLELHSRVKIPIQKLENVLPCHTKLSCTQITSRLLY
jgi:hypothetical protein